MLNIYTIHDDPTCHCEAEDRWWAAIAAETEQDALLIAVATYDSDGDVPDDNWREAFAIDRTIDISNWPKNLRPEYPQKIRDNEVHALRLCGFAEPDELKCDSCQLAALDIKKYYVCPDCEICRECGCECEET